ncbi:MEIOB (predicted) [Pycnogonum litorale]
MASSLPTRTIKNLNQTSTSFVPITQNNSNRTCTVVNIANLEPNFPNALIAGLLIAKQEPRTIPNKRDPGKERHLMSFTIRDSPTDMINGTCWGESSYISYLANTFHIGDIVEIGNPQVQKKQDNVNEERYHPYSTSPFQLNVSENHSGFYFYNGDTSNLMQLRHIPTKATNDFYTLSDVSFNGEQLHGEHINLLVAAKSIGNVRDLVTRYGNQVSKLDLTVFDQTSLKFTITVWNNQQIDVVKSWIPGEHVVFIADIKMQIDNFRKCMVGTCDNKTVFTVNPDTPEAHLLYQYVMTKKQDFLQDDDGETLVFGDMQGTTSLEGINDVYTVEDLKKKLYDRIEETTFYGVTFSLITTLDLDGCYPVTMTRCTRCKKTVLESYGQCSRPECPIGMGADSPQSEELFRLSISLSDHTGTIHRCRMSGVAVERSLGCTLEGFQEMDANQITEMKWNFLLERCKVYFKAMSSTFESDRPVVQILGFCRANAEEHVKSLKDGESFG